MQPTLAFRILGAMDRLVWHIRPRVKLRIGVAVAIFCVLLTQVSAQTLAITSEVAVWPTAPVEWAGVDAVAIANSPKPVLLSGGDWLLATSSSTRTNNNFPRVDRFGFERRSSNGKLLWQVARASTKSSMVPVAAYGDMVVTRSGLFHALVGGEGRSLWTGTVDGVLLREESTFSERLVGLYGDRDQLVVAVGPERSNNSSLRTFELDGVTQKSVNLGAYGAPKFIDDSSYWFLGDGLLSRVGTNGLKSFQTIFRTGDRSPVFGLRHFKWLGDKSLLGGEVTGPSGNDLSQSFGLQDAWLVWTDLQGNRTRDGVYGGVGRETLEGWVQTEDGGFVLAIDSRGSGVSGNKTIDGDGVWLVKISSTGAIQGQRLIPNQLVLAMGSSETGISLLVRDAATGTRVQSIQIATEVIAKIRALAPEPFDLLTSTNLQTWRVLGTQVFSEVEFSQPARQGTQFYRMVPAQR